MLAHMRLFKFSLVLIITASSAHIDTIILDCDGVVSLTHNSRLYWQIGPRHFLSYLARLNNPKEIKRSLFSFLDSLEQPKDEQYKPTDPSGHTLPQIMCDWFKGTKSSRDILQLIDQELQTFRNDLFSSRPQQRLVHTICRTIFDPQNYVKTRRFNKKSLSFLRWAKKQGFKLYLLSNWDRQSFAIFSQLHADVFSLFDGMVISGEVGLLKPDPRIYKHLCTTYKLNPATCLFIDDQWQNIQVAQQVGMKSVVYKKHLFKKLRFGQRNPNQKLSIF